MLRFECNQFDLVQEVLKLRDIHINKVEREVYPDGLNRIVINLEPTDNVKNCCPHCGKICDVYDTPRPNDPAKLWRSLDMGNEITVLEYKPHRVVCPEHGIVTAFVPWAYPHACFTREFDQQVTWMARQMSKTAVSEYMRITWPTVGRCISRVKNDVEPDTSSRLNGLVKIGIDENAVRKGSNHYIMIVVNHLTNEVVWAREGRSKQVLSEFFEELTDEQRSTIQLVSADGAEWIHDVVKHYCPKAVVCIDTFHVFKWVAKAENAVRLEEWRKKNMEVRELKADKQDVKDEREESDSKELKELSQMIDAAIKNARADAAFIKSGNFLYTSNPDNLTPEQILAQQQLMNLSPVLLRVHGRVQTLRDIMHSSDYDAADAAFDKWIGWARRSRLEPFKSLASTLKNFKESILNTIKYGLTNARVEANNNIIKGIIRRGYGFRNIKNLIDLIMLTCSKRYVVLPNRGMEEKSRSRWRVYRTHKFVPVAA